MNKKLRFSVEMVDSANSVAYLCKLKERGYFTVEYIVNCSTSYVGYINMWRVHCITSKSLFELKKS